MIMCAVFTNKTAGQGEDSNKLTPHLEQLDLRLADAQLPRIHYLKTEDRAVVSDYLCKLMHYDHPVGLKDTAHFLISITVLSLKYNPCQNESGLHSNFLERLVKICKDALAKSEKSSKAH